MKSSTHPVSEEVLTAPRNMTRKRFTIKGEFRSALIKRFVAEISELSIGDSEALECDYALDVDMTVVAYDSQEGSVIIEYPSVGTRRHRDSDFTLSDLESWVYDTTDLLDIAAAVDNQPDCVPEPSDVNPPVPPKMSVPSEEATPRVEAPPTPIPDQIVKVVIVVSVAVNGNVEQHQLTIAPENIPQAIDNDQGILGDQLRRYDPRRV